MYEYQVLLSYGLCRLVLWYISNWARIPVQVLYPKYGSTLVVQDFEKKKIWLVRVALPDLIDFDNYSD